MQRNPLVTIFAVLALTPTIASAQFLGISPANPLRNVEAVKLPKGQKVGIVVFEDLGCPACAHAHPFEEQAAAKAHVPLLRFDYPIPSHIWTFQGAVCARYIEEKISPQLADQFRRDVFAAQRMIASQDDLQHFTRVWLEHRGKVMPFLLDGDGSLAKKVDADSNLGRRLNVQYTPTVLVIANGQYQVVCGTGTGPDDPNQILPVVEAALAKTQHGSK